MISVYFQLTKRGLTQIYRRLNIYLQPENEHEYYDVVFQSGEYQKTLLKESVLLEDKLPAEGYVLSGEKRENVVINLPIKDRSLLAELVRKFGWACM